MVNDSEEEISKNTKAWLIRNNNKLTDNNGTDRQTDRVSRANRGREKEARGCYRVTPAVGGEGGERKRNKIKQKKKVVVVVGVVVMVVTIGNGRKWFFMLVTPMGMTVRVLQALTAFHCVTFIEFS